MKFFLRLRLVLLPLQLTHLFLALVLLASEIVLHLLVGLRSVFNLLCQLLFLLFQLNIAVGLCNLLLDAAMEVGKGQISFHLTSDSVHSLDETFLVTTHLVLVLLDSRLLLE